MHQQLTFGGMLLFPILIYLRYYAGDRDDAIFYMGLFCSSVTVLSYGSPLAAMVRPLQYFMQLMKQVIRLNAAVSVSPILVIYVFYTDE